MSMSLQNIYQVTQEQYEKLVSGEAVGTHTFDANALYLVEGEDAGSDTKVQVDPYTDNAEYPIVINPSTSGTSNTNTMGFKTGVTINPSTSTITASYFNGYAVGGRKADTTIGECATAEGAETTASGDYSHAEGVGSTVSGYSSHAEGKNTTASGDYSHAEGAEATASGEFSHAEGYGTTASGESSHAEGYNTTAAGNYSHAEGMSTKVTNDSTVTATAMFSMVAGNYGHAEGCGTVSYGTASHAEGNGTMASGRTSHAEGYSTTASGDEAHAEGSSTTASGDYSHAEGFHTTASGEFSHAEGWYTTASGAYSHAGGIRTIANNFQYVVGKYNTSTTAPTGVPDTTTSAGLFIIGIGTNDSARSNGFRVNPAGNVYGVGSFNTSGADYAEYFEWLDGNPNNEDRRGRFVTLDGGKIRYATIDDDYILGVVSAEPSMAGDVYSEDWHNRYLKDIYGNKIIEVVEVEETIDDNGKIIPAHTERRWVLNPNYDPNATYVSREERPEWAAIGILGKLVVVDDGTCQVNGYCQPNTGGIATASQDKTNYRVMERLDDTHIKIFIR